MKLHIHLFETIRIVFLAKHLLVTQKKAFEVKDYLVNKLRVIYFKIFLGCYLKFCNKGSFISLN